MFASWRASAPRRETHLTTSICGKDPVKGQDPKELCFGGFAVPSASGIGAGKLLVSEYLHCLDLGERSTGTLLL